MAINACPECNKPVSSSAEACPHCGYKTAKRKAGGAKALLVSIVAVAITATVVTCASPSKPTAQSTPEDERRLKEEVGALIYLRDRMKNPASFDLVSFIRTQDNTLCIVYRGTNSFNAIVTQRYAISNTVSSASDDAWAANCAGRQGTDVSKAKYALP